MRDHVRRRSIPRLTAIAAVATALIGLSGAVLSGAQAGPLRQPGPRGREPHGGAGQSVHDPGDAHLPGRPPGRHHGRAL